ncbi:hypothetical protein HDF16_000121 [Granulicella aggregans]|uniref:Uncharacterized protein n=1 Tax=Granulicella aggregans TaxID=474949 RepID=A0A7W7Z951_9BACT|nr:hypothetical protein [Granulicella aggregans]MBB5055452.1 hypothetical protein [Granulicella aggregans]
MSKTAFTGVAFPWRTRGWLAIASGVVGLIAFALLMAAVTSRTTWIPSGRVYLLFRAHDVGVVLQFILWIPLAFGLQTLSLQNAPSLSRGTITWGIAAISLVAVLLLLSVGKIVNDMFYMLPQGVFGAWLIVVNVRLSRLLPRWLRYFGIVVGLGLVLVGTVFPGLAVFVYPNMLRVPAVPVDDETLQQTEINRILHLVLAIGSLLGVVTLPIWTLLLGSRLLRVEDPPASTTDDQLI